MSPGANYFCSILGNLDQELISLISRQGSGSPYTLETGKVCLDHSVVCGCSMFGSDENTVWVAHCGPLSVASLMPILRTFHLLVCIDLSSVVTSKRFRSSALSVSPRCEAKRMVLTYIRNLTEVRLPLRIVSRSKTILQTYFSLPRSHLSDYAMRSADMYDPSKKQFQNISRTFSRRSAPTTFERP
jgi:hypothetical protein